MRLVSQSASELVFVDILVLGDVPEGAVVPRAASRPPEKALSLVCASEQQEKPF